MRSKKPFIFSAFRRFLQSARECIDRQRRAAKDKEVSTRATALAAAGGRAVAGSASAIKGFRIGVSAKTSSA